MKTLTKLVVAAVVMASLSFVAGMRQAEAGGHSNSQGGSHKTFKHKKFHNFTSSHRVQRHDFHGFDFNNKFHHGFHFGFHGQAFITGHNFNHHNDFHHFSIHFHRHGKGHKSN